MPHVLASMRPPPPAAAPPAFTCMGAWPPRVPAPAPRPPRPPRPAGAGTVRYAYVPRDLCALPLIIRALASLAGCCSCLIERGVSRLLLASRKPQAQ